MKTVTRLILTLITTTTLIQGQYKIEPLTNPLLPISQGTSYIITGAYQIYYHINLTDIELSITEIKQTLFDINHTINNLTTPLKEPLLIRSRDLLNQAYSIQIFTKHYINKRQKRGLFNIVGTIQHYLFGTLDADDGIKYDNYIKLLEENQHVLKDDIATTQSVLRNITKTFDVTFSKIKLNQERLQNSIQGLSKRVTMNEFITHLVLIFNNIENNLNIIGKTCDNIQTAINFAKTSTLHHSIIKYNDLRKVIDKIKVKQRIPFDNIIKYYETAYTDVIINNNLIIFHIGLPLINNNPYTLYYLYSIPFQNRIMILKNTYLLINKEDFFNLDQKCIKVEGINLCPKEQLNKNEGCIVKTINIQSGHCHMTPITYNQTGITQLKDNTIIIIPALEEKITFTCFQRTSVEIIKSPSLITPSKCTVDVKNEHFESQNFNTINMQLKLPAIKIDNNLVNKVKPINLEKINLNSVHNELKAVNSLITHPLHSLDIGNNQTMNIIFVIIIVLTLLGLGIYIIIVKLRSRRKRNCKMSIELKPLENATPFSQT